MEEVEIRAATRIHGGREPLIQFWNVNRLDARIARLGPISRRFEAHGENPEQAVDGMAITRGE